MNVLIEARRPGATDWAIRNRLGEQNFLYREGKMPLADLIDHAERMIAGWSYVEPLTEFRVEITNAYQGRPRAEPEALSAQQLKELKSIRRYNPNRTANSQAAGSRKSQSKRTGRSVPAPGLVGAIDE